MAFEGEAARHTPDGIIRDEQALSVFYLSLALIVVGVGFKPNISTVVGKLYAEGDPRRDADCGAHMGINVGAFTATLLCGWLGEVYGWSWGFGAAGIGCFSGSFCSSGVINSCSGTETGQTPTTGWSDRAAGDKPRTRYLPREHRPRSHCLAAGAAYRYGWHAARHPVAVGPRWPRLVSGLSLRSSRTTSYVCADRADTPVFQALFEQAAGSMTLYTDRVTDKALFGVELTGAVRCGERVLYFHPRTGICRALDSFESLGLGAQPPVKFALGIAQAGMGFGALVYGAQFRIRRVWYRPGGSFWPTFSTPWESYA